ncbi:MAG: hypothetical protein ACI9UK_002286 [Candidatus Krumholzibacteriia bacterium]|jgi:hypothetical protein
MKKIILLSLVVVLANVGTATAGKNSFGLAWNVSAPVGDTSDFTPGLHFRGASFYWQSFYTRDMAIGINASWNVFNDNNQGTFVGDDFAATGQSWRYQNLVPIYASWHKYWGNDRRGKRTFAGINAGTVYLERRLEYGIVQIDEDNWHMALAPELGMQMPWDSFLGWVSVRYNYAFSAGEADAQQWFEFRVGFGM